MIQQYSYFAHKVLECEGNAGDVIYCNPMRAPSVNQSAARTPLPQPIGAEKTSHVITDSDVGNRIK